MNKPTREDFIRTVESEPILCEEGLFGSLVPRKQRNFQESRQSLLQTGYEQFVHCVEWLSLCTFRKTPNDKIGHSYNFKHSVERWAGTYVSTGAFIAAVLFLKIDHSRYPDWPHIYLPISSKCPMVRQQSEITKANQLVGELLGD